jgi:Co/Zn/Cd efflux system component
MGSKHGHSHDGNDNHIKKCVSTSNHDIESSNTRLKNSINHSHHNHGHEHGHQHSHGHSHGHHGHHGHGHSHAKFCGCCYFPDKYRLSCMLGMTFLFFLVELIAGQITKSISLTTDAFHMFVFTFYINLYNIN